MKSPTKDDFIWTKADIGFGQDCLIGARVFRVEQDRFWVFDEAGQERWLSLDEPVIEMHPTSVQGVEDMVHLHDVHDASVLRNIAVRYSQKLIYTSIGAVLISVNPYVDIPVYSAKDIRRYSNKRIGEMSPHIFATADQAYRQMLNKTQDQCIMISGESGSGKTENAKLVLQFLATISGQHSWIEQQIIQVAPILEAFGNAQTVCNNNSSRFGYSIDLHFGPLGAINAANIRCMKLEKSRVVAQSPGNSNFNIFYYLLTGLCEDELQELLIEPKQSYYFLNEVDSNIDQNHAAMIAEVRSSMKILMFKDYEIWSCFKLLAALLHIGEIQYGATMINDVEAAVIRDADGVEKVARLLQVDEQLLVNALTTKSIVIDGERIVYCLTIEQGLDNRDSLVKNIYNHLFIYLVKRINEALRKPVKNEEQRYCISILDMFGFEKLERNSFEQLCINYANEILQQCFIETVFKSEQSDYKNEGINWTQIEIDDNAQVIDLIDNTTTISIFSIINEETISEKGTDQGMLTRFHSNFGAFEKQYSKPESNLKKTFSVKHYANTVEYNSKGFIDKNRDKFSIDVLELLRGGKFRFLKLLLDDCLDCEDISIGQSSSQTSTMISEFRESLRALIHEIEQRQLLFVRCINPNVDRKPFTLDRDYVYAQLLSMNVIDTVRIRNSGYPVSFTYEKFVAKYRMIVNGIGPPHLVNCVEAARQICDAVFGEGACISYGKTKIFLKDSHGLLFEQKYECMLEHRAVTIQRVIRGWMHRIAFERMREAVICVQRLWRGRIQRNRYKQMQIGFARLQAILRSRQVMLHYRMIRTIITQFQACCRGVLVRNKLRRMIHQGHRFPGMMVPQVYMDNHYANSTFNVTHLENQIPMDGLHSSIQRHSTTNLETFNNWKQHISETNGTKQKVSNSTSTTASGDQMNKYQFGKFATAYFQRQIDQRFSRCQLHHSLLQHSNEIDSAASLAIWCTILRFMGDFIEPVEECSSDENGSEKVNIKDSPMMNKLSTILGRNGSKRLLADEGHIPQATQLVVNDDENVRPDQLSGYSQTNSCADLVKYDVQQFYDAIKYGAALSNLDNLNFIIGHGILRQSLRDEIYCQICKQLIGNPSLSSSARGWILLSLCVGCFTPSQMFLPYLQCFIKQNCLHGATKFSSYIEQKLQRTIQNGARDQPPSLIEIQAAKIRKPISLGITLMDGRLQTMETDSATTAHEVCDELALRIGLDDKFGFSLFISCLDQVSSIGSANNHIFDAVSQCEQNRALQEGAINPAWRLFYRKEIFSPWHDTSLDIVCTDLIYQQVLRGIRFGEYRTDKEDELSAIMAQHYYIDHGPTMVLEKLENSLLTYLPEHNIQEADTERWLHYVLHAFRKKFSNQSPKADEVKGDVVLFAKNKWPLLFSVFFEAFRYSDVWMTSEKVVIALNSNGLFVMDDDGDVLQEFQFAKIERISNKSLSIGTIAREVLLLETVDYQQHIYITPNIDELIELFKNFFNGLQQRSKFLVALQNFMKNDQKSELYLEFQAGDLLMLTGKRTGSSLSKNQFVRAENLRTGEQGDIPVSLVHILPTSLKPSLEIMNLFTKSLENISPMNKRVALYKQRTMMNEREFTLECFATSNFRDMVRQPRTSQALCSIYNGQLVPNNLWSYSCKPLKAPLLKKLHEKPEPSHEAIKGYLAILQFTGDFPTQPISTFTELTDRIFLGPIKFEILRDELYCQLMKQLTYNYNLISCERTWELLWLCTGLFAPSQSLQKVVELFLTTNRHFLSVQCLSRMHKIIKAGRRKYPPHEAELDAVRQRTQIFHRIFLPDNSEEAVEVESSTRAVDFIARIAVRLGLRNSDGFSLFIRVNNKVISVPSNEFFFDFLRQTFEWTCPRKDRTVYSFSYQIYFMRKLWIDVHPGNDPVADIIFHYPQELSKYLRGYHNVTRQQSIELAALILRARTSADRPAPLAQLTQIISSIVPRDLIKSYGGSDWKKMITKCYVERYESMAPNDAKICFLQTVAKWPTYGCAFFEVKQSSDTTLPSRLLISINNKGVDLFNLETKAHIVNYPFTIISNWNSGNTYFHMTIGNLMKGTRGARLLLETPLAIFKGYKMDDLITSYIKHYLSIASDNNNQRELDDELHIA